MVFSSPLFLFCFLPLVVGIYYALPGLWRNSWLLLASFGFYFIGSGAYIMVLFGSIVWNFSCALWLDRFRGSTARRFILAGGIIGNLASLIIFKYSNFAVTVLNDLRISLGARSAFAGVRFFLPAGISFFTFQGIAYLIDIYRRELPACRSLPNYALFKSFFPQLIAGPIVRYHYMASDLPARKHSLAQVAEGLVRFGFGLGKKVILADNLGRVADSIFALDRSQLSASVAWIGVVAYSFQILFDFSGYSDMAIGLGLVFGLHLPENFLRPYTATCITDFWRRWHITLSTWFRDYLYIPLGGNRRGLARTGINLLVVFALCGLWHGAAFTFIVWGLFHGVLLLIERVAKFLWNFEPKGLAAHAITLGLIMVGWTMFRAQSVPQAITFLKVMFGISDGGTSIFGWRYYLTANICCYLAVSSLCAFWPPRPIGLKTNAAWLTNLRPYAALCVACLAVVEQSPQSFNPFIYFQF